MKQFLLIIILLFAAAATMAATVHESESATVTAKPSAAVRVCSSGIEVHNASSTPCGVEVYSLTGQLVLNETAQSGITTFFLAPGHYIVRINSKATKIVIR